MAGQSGQTARKGDRKPAGKLASVVSEIWYQLVPFPRLLLANHAVRAKEKTVDPREAAWATLGRDALVLLLEAEWERAKSIDEKLFKLTTALSVAVAAVGVASKTVVDALPDGPGKIILLAVLPYAIASVFAGALMGFAGLRPKPRSGYGPDFALQIRDDKVAAARLADALMDFENKNTLRANEASAANLAIRNGVAAFALAMTFSLFVPPKAAPAEPARPLFVHLVAIHRETPPLTPTPLNVDADREADAPARPAEASGGTSERGGAGRSGVPADPAKGAGR